MGQGPREGPGAVRGVTRLSKFSASRIGRQIVGKTHGTRIAVALLVAGVLLLAANLASAASAQFSYHIAEAALTSGGIYDSQGRLVRVLWTMENRLAGTFVETWDGRDDVGSAAPPGSYTWKVVINRSTCENIGTVGNTGKPQATSGHVPFFIEGVAVDAAGAIYTVHDWDEAHHDVIKWSGETGEVDFHTKHPVGEALLKGIAVEPDGSFAYVSGYSDLQDRSKAQFSIWCLDLSRRKNASVAGFTQAGRKIKVYEGNAQYPEHSTSSDRALMAMPLLSMAVRGNILYVTRCAGRACSPL